MSELHSEVAATPLTLSLRPIGASVSLRDRAYAMLRQAIADADIYQTREDVRLDDRVLSESLGVSRTPVREAMTRLEQEGFLRTVPRRGIYIVRKSKREVVEMITVWAAIESMAARLAAPHVTAAEIAELRALGEAFQDDPDAHTHQLSNRKPKPRTVCRGRPINFARSWPMKKSRDLDRPTTAVPHTCSISSSRLTASP